MEKNTEKYFAYFQSILNCFTAEFLSAYYQYENFHDFHLRLIKSIQNSDGTYNCYILCEDYSVLALIILDDCSAFNIVSDGVPPEGGKTIDWGYSEFEKLSDNHLKLNVLFDNSSEYEFIFRSIGILIDERPVPQKKRVHIPPKKMKTARRVWKPARKPK